MAYGLHTASAEAGGERRPHVVGFGMAKAARRERALRSEGGAIDPTRMPAVCSVPFVHTRNGGNTLPPKRVTRMERSGWFVVGLVVSRTEWSLPVPLGRSQVLPRIPQKLHRIRGEAVSVRASPAA